MKGPVSLRIMLVAPYFAPSAMVGAKRFSFLAQEFAHLGHDVDVLTVRLTRGERLDPTLPQVGKVKRVGTLLPHGTPGASFGGRIYNRALAAVGAPDRHVGWLPTSVVTGWRMANVSKPDVVIATGPPFTAFLSGAILNKVSGVPLVLDYRDPWTLYEWRPSSLAKARKGSEWQKKLERWVLGRASAAVFSSDVMAQKFEGLCKGPKPEVLRTITNGFHEPTDVMPRYLSPGQICILYAGNFYGERKLSKLLQALKYLSEHSADRFAVHVFGAIRAEDRLQIDRDGLTHLIHEHAPVAYHDMLEFIKGADILFLPSGVDVAYALPFKFFDYLSVRRPILAVTPESSAVAVMVRKLDCGEVAIADEVEEILNALKKLLSRRERYSYRDRAQFTWTVVARQYDDLIRTVLEERV